MNRAFNLDWIGDGKGNLIMTHGDTDESFISIDGRKARYPFWSRSVRPAIMGTDHTFVLSKFFNFPFTGVHLAVRKSCTFENFSLPSISSLVTP